MVSERSSCTLLRRSFQGGMWLVEAWKFRRQSLMVQRLNLSS